MTDPGYTITLKVINNPTILVRVIQVVKRRRININKLQTADGDDGDSSICFEVSADQEQVRLLKTQLNKLVDVVEVN